MSDVVDSVKIIREKLSDVVFKEFSGYGHFCYSNMNTDHFPELLEILVT